MEMDVEETRTSTKLAEAANKPFLANGHKWKVTSRKQQEQHSTSARAPRRPHHDFLTESAAH